MRQSVDLWGNGEGANIETFFIKNFLFDNLSNKIINFYTIN